MLQIISLLEEMPTALSSLLYGYDVASFPRRTPLREVLAGRSCDVIFIGGGLEQVELIKRADPRVEVMLFGTDDTEAVAAIQRGAYAFISEPYDADHLRMLLGRLEELINERKETADLEKKLTAKYTFEGVVGKNPKMLDIFNLIRRIGPYFKAVLITGETGTGKEVVAEALHRMSPSPKAPFVTCNCGALVENLIESELFGHKKGAFTGAIEDKKGLFEAAGEGTLFLDEIGELPLSFQPHLLRVLQSGEYRKLGSTQPSRALCRIVAASNRDISAGISSGAFREDLYYRISQFIIVVPPLRQRKDDIPLLCRFLLDRFVRKTGKRVMGISRPAQTALMLYDWPGNVRELENTIEHAAILTTETFIRLDDIPSHIAQPDREPLTDSANLDAVVKKHIEGVLSQCGGNRTEAAKRLGLSRWSLLRKLEKHGIT